jgi:hypothetical protein
VHSPGGLRETQRFRRRDEGFQLSELEHGVCEEGSVASAGGTRVWIGNVIMLVNTKTNNIA